MGRMASGVGVLQSDVLTPRVLSSSLRSGRVVVDCSPMAASWIRVTKPVGKLSAVKGSNMIYFFE